MAARVCSSIQGREAIGRPTAAAANERRGPPRRLVAGWAGSRRGRPRPMYQWLLGALGALLAAARRPAPPQAPPQRKRPSPSTQSSVKDPEEPQSKKRITGCRISERKEEVEVPPAVNLPAEATPQHQEASVSDAASIAETAEETQVTSDASSERPVGSVLEEEILEVGRMPCGTSTFLNKVTLPFSPIPYLSASRNDNHHVKPAPDSILSLRLPIKKRIVSGFTGSEVSKMGRILSAAEEEFKQEEKMRYKKLVELVKAKYPGSCPNPQLTRFYNVQLYSGNLMTASHLEEQNYRGNVYLCEPPKTGIRCADVSSLQKSPTSDKIRFCTPEEDSEEEEEPEEQAISEDEYETEISGESLFNIHSRPVLFEEPRHLHVNEEKLSKSEATVNCLPPLTEAMEREINAALAPGRPDEVMSSCFKLRVTREDIYTLSNYYWLNDEVVNFYMNLLVERSKKEGYPAVHAFSTFFYTKLLYMGYSAVRRWTRGVDLFKLDIILVPIHLGSHWVLVVIDVRKKTIKYFDSLGGKGDVICATLFQYLQEESQGKRNVELDRSEWTLRSMEPHEIPQQLNGSDCGVFMCKYAEYISIDKPLTFTQYDMPYFRRMMVWEIIHQQLL